MEKELCVSQCDRHLPQPATANASDQMQSLQFSLHTCPPLQIPQSRILALQHHHDPSLTGLKLQKQLFSLAAEINCNSIKQNNSVFNFQLLYETEARQTWEQLKAT